MVKSEFMSLEARQSSEIEPASVTRKSVPLAELCDTPVHDELDIGLFTSWAHIARLSAVSGIDTYFMLIDTPIGPKHLADMLREGTAKQFGRTLQDLMDDLKYPGRVQAAYEGEVLAHGPIAPGHYLADLKGHVKITKRVLAADPTMPDEIDGQPLGYLFPLESIEEDFSERGVHSFSTLRHVLFHEHDPEFYLALLRFCGLKPSEIKDNKGNTKILFNAQKNRIINKIRDKGSNAMQEFHEKLPQDMARGIIERYAAFEYGGYISEEDGEQHVFFRGNSYEMTNTNDVELTFNHRNLRVNAHLETLESSISGYAVVPHEEKYIEHVLPMLVWSNDTGRRAWTLETPSPTTIQTALDQTVVRRYSIQDSTWTERFDPVIGLMSLLHLYPQTSLAIHQSVQNRALTLPAFKSALVAAKQADFFHLPLINAAEECMD